MSDFEETTHFGSAEYEAGVTLCRESGEPVSSEQKEEVPVSSEHAEDEQPVSEQPVSSEHEEDDVSPHSSPPATSPLLTSGAAPLPPPLPTSGAATAEVTLEEPPDITPTTAATKHTGTPYDATVDREFRSKQLKRAHDHVKETTAWHAREIEKRWHYNSTGILASATNNAEIGALKRQKDIARALYSMNYNTMDMIVVTLRIFDNIARKELNYGTLFCELYDHISPYRQNHLAHPGLTYRNIVFTYFSASISHESADGEYRSRFSECRVLTRAAGHFPRIWSDLNDYIARQIPRRRWSLFQKYFYPKQREQRNEVDVEQLINASGMPEKVFSLTWFHMMYEKTFGTLDANINKKYKIIFGGYEEEDNLFFGKLVRRHGKRLAAFCMMTNRGESVNSFAPGMQVSYKMMLLNIREAQRPGKLIYGPWREYFVAARAADFTINSISPSFAVIFDWFYIKNSRVGLFDSESQEQRMRKSTIARGILQSLREAQRSTFFAVKHIEGVPRDDEKGTKGRKARAALRNFRDTRFQKLHRLIEEPISYCEEEIIMSEVALSFAMEYVGRTFGNSIQIVDTTPMYNKLIGRPFSTSGYPVFAKYMFEICYALLCCNAKLGAIHGDLHLNNATIGQLYVMTEKEIRGSRVVYSLGAEHQYVFRNAGFFACLIDFSRAIVDPTRHENFTDPTMPSSPQWRVVDDEDEFQSYMIEKMLHIYVYALTSRMKYRDELAVTFRKYPAAAFKLLTVVDIYEFTSRMRRTFAATGLRPSKACMKLVAKLNHLADVYLTDGVMKLMTGGASVAREVEAAEWPMLAIIKQCFGEFTSTREGRRYDGGKGVDKSPIVVTDSYSFDNELTHSLGMYSRFPKPMQGSTYRDKNNVLVDMFYEPRKQHREAVEHLRELNLAMVDYIARRHREKLF